MEKIKKSVKGVVSYFSLCIKYTFQNFFKKANAVLGSIFVTLFFLFSQHYHWFSDSDFENSLSGIILGFFLMIVARLLFAPYYIWNEDQDSINELSKIDKSDLENMLGGRFIFQNTFLYGGDVNICKRYDGKDKIMSLNNIYTAIKVMAPKNSLAQIKINTTYCSFCGQCKFYYKSDNDNEVVVDDVCDPYGFFNVYLDDKSSFLLKMMCSNSVTVEDNSVLLIEIKSWTK